MSRSTLQRAAVAKALENAAGPLLPDEILELGKSECPSLGQATVYRALKRLEERGEAERVVLADGRPRYEASRPHHHHFHCSGCGRVFDLPGCIASPKQFSASLPRGFVLERHELLLQGRCPRCAR